MPGTEPNTDEPDASVVSIGDAPSRRRLRNGRTSEPSPHEDIDRSAFDTGYEYTLDLADTAVVLPEEELTPDVDGILHRYEASPGVPSPETEDDPNTDEILTAISTHHGRSQQRGPRPAPRGSADLSPAAPRTKRRISLTPPPLRSRNRARARTALAAHQAIGVPAVSAGRRSHPRRLRVVVVGLLIAAAVALAAIVVSLSGRSAKSPSSTAATYASAVQSSLIGTTTGTDVLFHFLPRREFPWGAPRLVATKAKPRTPSKAKTHRTKAQTSSHQVPVQVTRTGNNSASTSSSHTTPKSSGHTAPKSSGHTTSTTTTHPSQSSSPRASAPGSSAACQAARVMAPTNCGKPSL